MIHDQFMKSHAQRQRYWGRGMVGWRTFDEKQPSQGHYALADLEQMGYLGVMFQDRDDFYNEHGHDVEPTTRTKVPGQRKLSIVTQNVDTFHRRAGTQHLIELHGRTDQLKCMNCGAVRDRRSFHTELESLNREWLQAALAEADASDLRADGDAEIKRGQYDSILIPSCTHCSDGFMKPDVVFFGDNVPVHRVAQCRAAVEACDGLLVVGSSLAVHSAFRHVRAAHERGVPIALLNVGETRAEQEGLDNLLKIEAPAGPTLAAVAAHLAKAADTSSNPYSDGQRRAAVEN